MIKKENNLIKILVPMFVFFVGCAAMYLLVERYPNWFVHQVDQTKKNVTITDNGIAEAVDKVYDSVVIVTTYQNGQAYASGTGFVFRTSNNDAYILTNNHVIENATDVNVTFTNGSSVETKIVGADTLSDIAVLSVNQKDVLSVAEIGKSDELKVGDTAFAVGAPLNSVYSWTVTRGIISGKDRMVEVKLSSSKEEYVMNVLQTDAAINSGNSGGPLCNANGEVVGITSLKLVDESVEGMGFAIPIETAIEYADKLINGEKITQPFLGVTMLNVSEAYYYPQFYSYLNEYKISTGVIVVDVQDGSPAAKAGLQSNDVITKIDDKDISSIGYLRYYLYKYEAGDKVTITYIRDGKEKKAKVTLENNSKVY